MTRTLIGSSIIAFLVGIGCAAPVGINFTGGSGGSSTGSSTGGSTGTGTIGTDSGIPCDVAAILTASCTSCHSNPPVGGATGPMLTYADLIAPSKSAPGKNVAQLAALRMKGTIKPQMPPLPAPAVSAADLATFEAWVTAGLPKGTCGADAGPPDPTFQGPPTCDSGNFAPYVQEPPDAWSDTQKAQMDPGQACVLCHDQNGGPGFRFGGTVFVVGKVKDLCLPPPTFDLTQAKVVLHDANGVDHTMAVDAVGNFRSGFGTGNVALPYTAKVVYLGNERPMTTPQMDGDCNGCHSAAGANNAPGRVALP